MSSYRHLTLWSQVQICVGSHRGRVIYSHLVLVDLGSKSQSASSPQARENSQEPRRSCWDFLHQDSFLFTHAWCRVVHVCGCECLWECAHLHRPVHAHVHSCPRAVISLMSSSTPHSLGSHRCMLQPQLPCLVRSPSCGALWVAGSLGILPFVHFSESVSICHALTFVKFPWDVCDQNWYLSRLYPSTALLVEGFQKETLILGWCLNKHIFSCWCFKFRLDYTLPRSKQTVIWLPPLLDNERTHLWANPEPEDLIFASCWQQWGVRRQKIQVGLFLLSQTFPHKLLSWPYLSILSTKCRLGSVVWFPTWWSFQERWWTTFLQLERNLEVSGFVLASHSWIFFSAFTRNA